MSPIQFFKRRQRRKIVTHILHQAKHARHMREDIADPERLEALSAAEQELRTLWQTDPDEPELEKKLEQLSMAAAAVYPPRPYPGIRENVEILTVAICIAMAFRTYFIQPFKIPTGSMQPTLFGIQVKADVDPSFMDKFPLRYLKFVATGQRYIEVRARTSGYLGMGIDTARRQAYFVVSDQKQNPRSKYIQGLRHRFYSGMREYVQPGDHVNEGDLLASGMVTAGDHIFVDKVRYNFLSPKRGQIVVFRTDLINHPQIQPTDHYIKRLAALPSETVSIQPPYLLINDQRVTEPYPFQRLIEEYGTGYTLARDRQNRALLQRRTDQIQIGPDEFLPLGDNTTQSLDGRYFGPVPTRSLIGPAFAVYWPFNARWGAAK